MPTSHIATADAASGVDADEHARHIAVSFASERAQATSDKYGAHTIELLAVKPSEEVSK